MNLTFQKWLLNKQIHFESVDKLDFKGNLELFFI